jgi:non-ribosomal peptide synthetase component E (peptide arylation enzyme)
MALLVEGPLALVTLSRAPVNAIDEAWLAQLDQALAAIEARADVAALLLRSTERAFCAGADLELMRSRFDAPDGRARMVAFVRELQRVYARLERLPQVTVAEIGGPALGGGLELALANGEVRVVDAEGREAPRGEIGALQVRGASLFVGYLKRPQLYKLDAEGWFDTGDLARMDTEGYIRICGRSKDVIIRGGENIPVVEIEAALYRVPGVVDAALVAMPDPRLQERACAFVTLQQGQRLDLATVCRRLAEEGYSKHFWPERLEVLAELPRTATGKIQKFVLRELAKELRPESATS